MQELHSRVDPETLDELDSPVELALNDIGTVTLRTSSVVIADAYADNRDTGAFILIDESTNDTVGAGTILEAREVKPARICAPTSAGIRRRWTAVTGGGPPGSQVRRSGSPGCPPPASRRSRWRWSARSSNRGGWPTCSTATTCATACPTTWVSRPATALKTSGG
ncbi:putative adenylyl-sulfate kinase [Mycobacterium xenopi 3993]|nr:putative adenylyl-sulfate kinase [Mycobacterium xenopi 3993]